MPIRSTTDLDQAFEWNVWMLEHLCECFDKGEIQSVLWIGVVLRTLLRDTTLSHSILQQKGTKNSLQFVSSAFPKGGICGWDVCSNTCNQTVVDGVVYAGLLRKRMKQESDGTLVLDYIPQFGTFPQKNKTMDYDTWKDEEVFVDTNVTLTREKIIQTVANKDGGAHFDMNIPDDYATFRQPMSLKIMINGTTAVFNQNPVYVSLRQIAWEVIETLK